MRPTIHGRRCPGSGHSPKAWKAHLERTLLLLVDVPRMLRDIVVDAVTVTGDVQIAGEVAGVDAVDAVCTTNADFVISGGLGAQLVSELLRARPAIGVLTVSDDGRGSTLHRLVERRTWLGELSPERLLAIVRTDPEAPS